MTDKERIDYCHIVLRGLSINIDKVTTDYFIEALKLVDEKKGGGTMMDIVKLEQRMKEKHKPKEANTPKE